MSSSQTSSMKIVSNVSLNAKTTSKALVANSREERRGKSSDVEVSLLFLFS